MWIIYTLIAGLLFTVQGLLSRHVLKGEKDAWAFSFYFSLIGAIVTFPFFLASPVIPMTWQPWLLTLGVGVVIVVHNLLYFKANNFLPASVSGSLSQIKLVWVLILGVLLLQESLTWEKVLGTLFAVIASLVVIGKFRIQQAEKGWYAILGSTFFYAVLVIMLKELFGSFNAVSVTFFASFLAPTFINFILMPHAFQRIRKIIYQDKRNIIVACVFGALANVALNYGLFFGQATKVLVIMEMFLVLTLVGEQIFFREKERLWVKVVAVIFAILAGILIRISA